MGAGVGMGVACGGVVEDDADDGGSLRFLFAVASILLGPASLKGKEAGRMIAWSQLGCGEPKKGKDDDAGAVVQEVERCVLRAGH